MCLDNTCCCSQLLSSRGILSRTEKQAHLKLPCLRTPAGEIFLFTAPWCRSSSPGGLALTAARNPTGQLALASHFLVSQNIATSLPSRIVLTPPSASCLSGLAGKGQTGDKLNLRLNSCICEASLRTVAPVSSGSGVVQDPPHEVLMSFCVLPLRVLLHSLLCTWKICLLDTQGGNPLRKVVSQTREPGAHRQCNWKGSRPLLQKLYSTCCGSSELSSAFGPRAFPKGNCNTYMSQTCTDHALLTFTAIIASFQSVFFFLIQWELCLYCARLTICLCPGYGKILFLYPVSSICPQDRGTVLIALASSTHSMDFSSLES